MYDVCKTPDGTSIEKEALLPKETWTNFILKNLLISEWKGLHDRMAQVNASYFGHPEVLSWKGIITISKFTTHFIFTNPGGPFS